MTDNRELLQDSTEDTLCFLDAVVDEAILGTAEQWNGPTVLAYDTLKCMELFCATGMSKDSADEHFQVMLNNPETRGNMYILPVRSFEMQPPNAEQTEIRDTLQEHTVDTLLFLDVYLDAAIVGTTSLVDSPTVVVYDSEKCIELMMTENEWSEEDALDWFYVNTKGAYVGPSTPLFLDKSME